MTLRITKFTFVSFCLFVCSFCLFVCLFEHRVFKCSAKRKRGWSSEQSSFKIWLNDFHSLQRFRHWNSHWKHFLPKMDHKTPVATTRCAENASQNDNGDNVCRNVTSNRWWHIFSILNELPSSVDWEIENFRIFESTGRKSDYPHHPIRNLSEFSAHAQVEQQKNQS